MPGIIPQRYEADVPLESLVPHPANANVSDIGLLGELINANGYATPILAQEATGLIIDGEHRLRAAEQRGMTHVPVVWLDIDDDGRDRLLASLNESTRRGTNDESKLVALLQGLATTPRGLEGTAFDGDDLDTLIAHLNFTPPQGNGDPDDAPEPPAEPVSVLGDLWLLGPHRLLCGDATNPDDLAQATGDMGTVGIVYIDPPYGIKAVPKDGGVSRGKLAPAAKYMQVTGDETTQTAADAFQLLSTEYPDALQVWWGGNHYAASAGLPDSSCWLIWDKQNGDNDFADAELAWTNHTGAVRVLRHMWHGMLRASEQGKRVHPNQKPVALAEWAFNVVDPTSKHGVILDTFAGSGSTLIAAHRTQRIAALIELEPRYCDVIIQRWIDQTGQDAVREDGTPWPGPAKKNTP